MSGSGSEVLVAGCWHLGSVVGACLADAGNQVWLWDQSPAVAAAWAKGKPPVHEPGLAELAKKHWGKGLSWAGSSPADAARRAAWVVLAYDTPIDDHDEVQLASVESGFDTVLSHGIRPDADFLFMSQIPVGTSRSLRRRIVKSRPDWTGHVLYSPENLRLGEGIKSFRDVDRLVVGIDEREEGKTEKLLSRLISLTGLEGAALEVMSLESAEMVKHALNSFLAACVVYANELSELCEATGADAWEVLASLRKDLRVGPKAYLRPGLGFSGGTLARDVQTLSHLSAGGTFFRELYAVNTRRNEWVVRKLREAVGDLAGRRVALLGITYKPGTSTVRRSPALAIGKMLSAAGAHCVALDPLADLGELSEAERAGLPFSREQDASSAFKGADAAVVVTEWPEFLELDWEALAAVMRSQILIDTKNMFERRELPRSLRVIKPGRKTP